MLVALAACIGAVEGALKKMGGVAKGAVGTLELLTDGVAGKGDRKVLVELFTACTPAMESLHNVIYRLQAWLASMTTGPVDTFDPCITQSLFLTSKLSKGMNRPWNLCW